MKFEIKHRLSGEILFSVKADSWKLAVEAAIEANADLRFADLRFANLRFANLSFANLSFANLSFADLSFADLRSADLRSANLSSANLSSANLSFANLSFADLSFADLSFADLSFANLSSANLSSANLSFADLRSANLSSANLSSANLSFADLNDIRNDFWSILLFAQPEIAGLRKAIVEGKIDGSVYEGDCACLVGTIANQRKCKVDSLEDNLKPDSSRPAERFFMGISKGHAPENNPVSKIVLEWLDEFATQIK